MKEIIRIEHLEHETSSGILIQIPELVLYEQQHYFIYSEMYSGLSEFLKLISGVINPDQGDVILMGSRLLSCTETRYTEIRKNISYAYQHGVMLSNLTIMENLLLPLNLHFPHLAKDEKIDFIQRTTEKASVSQLLSRRPVELRYIERKLLGIIRSLIIEPSCLVLDEPFQNLDIEYSEILHTLLDDYVRKGKQLIIGSFQEDSMKYTHQYIDMRKYLV